MPDCRAPAGAPETGESHMAVWGGDVVSMAHYIPVFHPDQQRRCTKFSIPALLAV